jgi:hypothetical protein
MQFVHGVTLNYLSALIFMVSFGDKPEDGSLFHQAQKAMQDS